MNNQVNGFPPEINAVLAKVRKLFNLANNEAAAAGERDNAMRMAQALLARHNLSAATVAETAVNRIKDHFESTADWERIVAYAVSRLFFCKFYTVSGMPVTVPAARGRTKTVKGYQFHFIGRVENVITAMEMSRWVVASIRREADRRFSVSKIDAIFGNEVDATEADREGFISGAALAVQDNADKLYRASLASNPLDAAATGTALVPLSYYESEARANAALLDRMGIHLRTGRGISLSGGAGFAAGKAYGSSLNLNRQVGSNAGTTKRLK